MNEAPPIQASNLSKRFARRQSWRSLIRSEGETLALDDISFTVRPGEVFGLLGPNGAGKTTLLKTLSALLLPTSGTVLVQGMDVVRHGNEVRRAIGLVYGDERSFFWRLSVFENLRFYAALYDLPRREADTRIHKLLELVDLAASAHVRMQDFSTGMKQRASIARALLNDPDVLFMDEPTRGLDPVGALELRQFVKSRVADGRRTVVLATNIMAEAEALCHRLAFINHGKIQLLGTLDALRTSLHPEEVYVVVASGLTDRDVAGVRGGPSLRAVSWTHLGDSTFELEVRVRPQSAAVPELIRGLVDAGASVWSCTRRHLSLDEVFAIAARDGGGEGVSDSAQRPRSERRDAAAASAGPVRG